MSKNNLTTILFLVSINASAMTIIYLANTHKLNIYIHPTSQWFVTAAAYIFLLLGIISIREKNIFPYDKRSCVGIACLIIITVLTLIIKPTPLSVETAKTRISTPAAPSNADSTNRFATRKTSDFTIIDWFAALADPREAFRYENTPANLSGFLLLKEGESMIGRLVITCCGADAQPALIPFEWTGELPEENAWIEVTGTMHTKDQKPFLKATHVEIIPEPSNPYAE